MTDEQIDALPDRLDSDVFTDRERAVLKACDQMALTNLHGYVDSDLLGDLQAHFSDGEILELGMVMAVLCGFAKFLFCFDLADREDSCPIHFAAAQ